MKIIAFSGKAGSGKSTAAQCVVEVGFKKLSFATPLKQFMDHFQNEFELPRVKDRELLVFIGKHVRKIAQCNGLLDPIVSKIEQEITHHSLVVIDDLRFPIEYEMLRKRGAIICRIVGREHNQEEMGGGSKQDESENALDDAKFDFVIENNSTVGEFRQKILNSLRLWDF